MKIIKINEVLEKMSEDINEVGFLTEYDGYIDEIIHEKADIMTEIYTHNLFSMAYSLWSNGYTERAVEELGESSGDLPGLLMSAHYLENLDHLYDILENAKLYAILYNLENDGIVELTEDEFEVVEDLAKESYEWTSDLEVSILEVSIEELR